MTLWGGHRPTKIYIYMSSIYLLYFMAALNSHWSWSGQRHIHWPDMFLSHQVELREQGIRSSCCRIIVCNLCIGIVWQSGATFFGSGSTVADNAQLVVVIDPPCTFMYLWIKKNAFCKSVSRGCINDSLVASDTKDSLLIYTIPQEYYAGTLDTDHV